MRTVTPDYPKLTESHASAQRAFFVCLYAGFPKAMEALKNDRKPDRGLMLAFLASAVPVTEREACGVWRWTSALRLGCVRVQLPCALRVCEWTAKFFL